MQRWLRELVIIPNDYARPHGRQPDDLLRMLIIVGIIAILIVPELRYRFISLLTLPMHYKEYREFGIRIPGSFSVHGIDVSRYQSRIDWQRVKEMEVGDIKLSFAFIKATEGSWLRDPQFNTNWTNARKHGVIRGAYHYFLPNISPRDQAANFTKTVRLASGDLPPVVDVEETRGMSKEQIRRNTKAFLTLLERHYGVKPILYTYKDFYKNHFADQPEFKGYRLWIAHFHVTSLNMPGSADWHFWQHSDRGSVSGINARVDFNVFNGELSDLQRLCVP
jgi:lysozyme